MLRFHLKLKAEISFLWLGWPETAEFSYSVLIMGRINYIGSYYVADILNHSNLRCWQFAPIIQTLSRHGRIKGLSRGRPGIQRKTVCSNISKAVFCCVVMIWGKSEFSSLWYMCLSWEKGIHVDQYTVTGYLTRLETSMDYVGAAAITLLLTF